MFNSEKEFLKASISPEVPVFIEFHLMDGQNGMDVARGLYQQGYRNLFITTGFASGSIQKPAEIIEIVGKDYPL